MVPTAPVFLTHVPSLVFVGIDWSSHHHLMHAVHHVNGSIRWANLDRPFWLPLALLVTVGIGENHVAPVPGAAQGIVWRCAAIAYFALAVGAR